MKKETLKIDLRHADNDDMVVLAHLLLNVSRLLSSNGCKVHIKKTQTKPVLVRSDEFSS